MADISPVDYASGLARAQTLVPDYVQQQLQRQLGALQTQNFALQNRRQQQEIDQNDSQAQNETAFENVMAHVADNPSALRSVAARFPKFAPGILAAAKGMEDSQRTQVVGDLSQVHSALSAGRPDLARAILQRHADADKAAGRETAPSDAAMLGMIDSGDPKQLKAAQGFAFSTMNALDPSVAKNLTEAGAAGGRKGQVVGRAIGHYDDDGKYVVDYRDPDPVEYRSVGAGETLYAVGGEGGGQGSGGSGAPSGNGAPAAGRTQYGWTPRARNGGDNTDAAVDGKIAGMSRALGISPTAPLTGLSPLKIAQALTLSEGGSGTLADRNNNPGNLTDPKTGGFRKFATKELGLQAAAAQVRRNLARGQNTIQTMVEGLPVRGSASASSNSAMQGGARVVAQGAPKPGYQMLTAEETASQGLDPNVKYQRAPDGQITALGGQSKAQLKPWPATALSVRTTNTASLKSINGVLSLLDPKNNSAEAKTARAAIGPGTGMLGDTFTQWNDPEGTDARARIGQIGGLIIKDTSGAAVSISEDQRLAKWIPLITDKVPVARAKLANLARAVTQLNQAQDETYSEDQGYRPFSQSTGQIATVRSIQQAQKLAPGTLYRAPDGKVRRR